MARQTGVVDPISACDVLVDGLADEYDRSEAGLPAPDGKNHGGHPLSLSLSPSLRPGLSCRQPLVRSVSVDLGVASNQVGTQSS